MINKVIIFFLKAYQILVSPMLGSNCRYNPTCSNYSIECFKKLPVFHAFWYSLKRILKCNAFFNGGDDPAPSLIEKHP